jgi:hypothetical protein
MSIFVKLYLYRPGFAMQGCPCEGAPGHYSRLEAAASRAGVPAETLVRTAISRLLGQGTHYSTRELEDLGRPRATPPPAGAIQALR